MLCYTLLLFCFVFVSVILVYAFFAIGSTDQVVTWGNSRRGGCKAEKNCQLQEEVVQISASMAAFAALKSDGSVVTWGARSCGGDGLNGANRAIWYLRLLRLLLLLAVVVDAAVVSIAICFYYNLDFAITVTLEYIEHGRWVVFALIYNGLVVITIW